MAKSNNYEGFLRLLHKSKPAYRRTLLQSAPNELIGLLSRGVLNILKGRIAISRNSKQKLGRYKKQLRTLADKKTSVKKKKKVLQSGGFLPLLLPLLGPLLGGIGGAVLNKVIK